jgi:hypothetical protein
MRPEAGHLFWILLLVACCASQHPLGAEWGSLPLEEREARAIETVRTALAQREAKVPRRPRIEENEVLYVGRRLAIFTPFRERAEADVPPTNLSVLLFQDITGLERRVLYDFPSHPEDLSIYLRSGSLSVWGVQANVPPLSSLLSSIGVGGPVLLLPRRPGETYWRLDSALEYLLSLPRPREGVGVVAEKILRQSVEEQRGRARFEAELTAALEEYLVDFPDSAGKPEELTDPPAEPGIVPLAVDLL